MRIAVEAIEDGGRALRVGLGDSWAIRAVAEALEGELSALDAELLLEKSGRVVRVSGALSAAVSRECDRCAELVHIDVATDVQLSYMPEGELASTDEELELGINDLDLGWYTDRNLDLTAVLAEAAALALPSRITCTDEEACDTRTRSLLEASRDGSAGHPGFAALSDLLEP